MIDLGELYRGDRVRLVRDARGRRLPPRVVFVEQVRGDPWPDGTQVYVHFNRPVSDRWVRPDQIEFVASGDGRMPHEYLPIRRDVWTEEERERYAEAEAPTSDPISGVRG